MSPQESDKGSQSAWNSYVPQSQPPVAAAGDPWAGAQLPTAPSPPADNCMNPQDSNGGTQNAWSSYVPGSGAAQVQDMHFGNNGMRQFPGDTAGAMAPRPRSYGMRSTPQDWSPQKRQANEETLTRSELLTFAGGAVLTSVLLRAYRSQQSSRSSFVSKQLANLKNVGNFPLTALGIAVGALLSRLVPKLLAYLALVRSRNSAPSRMRGNKDAFALEDPWSSGARSEKFTPRSQSNPWSTYAGSPQQDGPSREAPRNAAAPNRFGTFFEGTREEYLRQHVSFRLREQIHRMNLHDTAVFH